MPHPLPPPDDSTEHLERLVCREAPVQTTGTSAQSIICHDAIWPPQDGQSGFAVSEAHGSSQPDVPSAAAVEEQTSITVSRLFAMGAGLLALMAKPGAVRDGLWSLGYRGYFQRLDTATTRLRVALQFPSPAQLNDTLRPLETITLVPTSTPLHRMHTEVVKGLMFRRCLRIPYPDDGLNEARIMIGQASMYSLLPRLVLDRLRDKAVLASSRPQANQGMIYPFAQQIDGFISTQLSSPVTSGLLALPNPEPLGQALSVLVDASGLDPSTARNYTNAFLTHITMRHMARIASL